MSLADIDLHRILLALHLFGFAIGVGGATVTDVFFFKFLRDYKISKTEADFMRTLSQIMWGGVLLLALSGLGLFLLDPGRLLASTKFLSKMAVVIVLVTNGTFLHLYVTPKLHKIAYMPSSHPKKDWFRAFREKTFVSGAVSIVSWYFAFGLAMSRFKEIPLHIYLGVYAILLVAGFGGALMLDWILGRKADRIKRSN